MAATIAETRTIWETSLIIDQRARTNGKIWLVSGVLSTHCRPKCPRSHVSPILDRFERPNL